jgi:outer membrane protein TolC
VRHAVAAAALAGALAAGTAETGEAQGSPRELTLAEALGRADVGAYGNRIAGGRAQAQAGEAQRALQGILPTLRLETGYARTTDPIGTFGMTLRQRRITQADFDPAVLNHPAARADYGASLIIEQPLVNVDAHAGRQAASHATAAVRSHGEWIRGNVRVDVVRGFYGAVLMAERVATLEAAERTAAAHVRQAAALKREGLVTRSDELLASVRAGEVETRLLEARGEAALVKQQLALLLGAPADTAFTLPVELPAAATLNALHERPWPLAVDDRNDVAAARAGNAAARADVRRARATLLPRINAMARYDWHSADAPFGGDENWSVGVMASWTPFAGGSQLADVRAAAGRATAAAAEYEAAHAAAKLEAATAATTWRTALERVRIAGAAVEQSAEAHRIVLRRYEGGLAGVVELLDAAALETESRLRYSHARFDAVVAAAERLHRNGHDPADIAALLVATTPERPESR